VRAPFVVVIAVAGCGDQFGMGGSPEAPADAYVAYDTDARVITNPPFNRDSWIATDPVPAEPDRTTGAPCKTDDECDVTARGINICTEGAFGGGDSLYPTPVCVGTTCDPGDVTKVTLCDGDRGVCLPTTTSGGICLPACAFSAAAAAPTGCIGRNVCHAMSWSADAAGEMRGVGYCFGGCRADADCPIGNICQTETSLCRRTKIVFPKLQGTACNKDDLKEPAKCECVIATGGSSGYCANFCLVGESCDAGFSCDALLPMKEFSAVPTGLAARCLKNCTTDDDCAGLSAYCEESAGMAGQKTCHPGMR
jgi:hypothetical protein